LLIDEGENVAPEERLVSDDCHNPIHRDGSARGNGRRGTLRRLRPQQGGERHD
jgi:hypothetical protein